MMDKRYALMTKAELIRQLERMEKAAKRYQRLQLSLENLRTYEEEVRIQNEQLTEAQRLLEQSRDRYADLYDFAPFAYLTLDENGLVVEANLTATLLLGTERANIIGKPLMAFVADESRRPLLAHLVRC